MTLLARDLFPPPFALSSTAERSAVARQAELTKPHGALGALESVAIAMAAAAHTPTPSARPARAFVFAADHEVNRHSVSAYPRAVTRAMVSNFVTGGAAACVMARTLSIPLELHDVGVDRSGGSGDGSHERGSSSAVRVVRYAVADAVEGDLVESDAMSELVFEAAVHAGRDAIANAFELESPPRVVILGELGIGNTTLAAAVAASVLDLEAGDVVGRGTGVDDDGMERKRKTIAAAMWRVGRLSPLEALRRLGGRELAAIAGAAAEAAARGAVVLVDGFVVSVAVLAVARETPNLASRFLLAHRSAESGHRKVLDALTALGAPVGPLLDLGMRLGEGTGALSAFPLIELACRTHSDMATFASASVPVASETLGPHS